MIGKIYGTGSSLPKRIVSNHDLAKIVDTNDAWIRERTGIGARHVSTSEGTSALATEAAKRAIADAGISPEEIEIVIVATSSPDRAFPSAAADVQGAIGAKHAVAFDITAACSGFIYALHIVQGFIQAGIYKTALIIGAETLSKVLDWTDRSSCILFGDGAGAAVVRADETGVVKTLVGSDGTKNDVLYCQARSLENCLTGGKPELGFMQMDGQEVFKFAVKKVPEIVNAILEETGTDREAVQHYLLHQANIRILEAASRRLKVPMDKIPVNIERYGNTSAASIPILLDEMHRDGRLKRGDTLVMAGFGAGLTWGAALMTWSVSGEAKKYIANIRTVIAFLRSQKENSFKKEIETMLEKMKEIIAEQLSVDADSITEASSFKDDLGADSLDLFELVMALEDEYSVEIPAEDLQNLATVGDVMNYLKEKGVEA